MRTINKLILISFFFVTPISSFADIYDCNGVITNTSCEGAKLLSEEKVYEAPDAKTLEDRRKSMQIQNFELKGLKAYNEYGLSFDTTLTKEYCNSASLQDCLQFINKKDRELTLLIESEKKRVAKEDKDTKATVNNNQNNNNVTVVDDRDNTFIDGSLITVRRPYQPRNRFPPYIDPRYQNPGGYMPNNPSPYAPATPDPKVVNEPLPPFRKHQN